MTRDERRRSTTHPFLRAGGPSEIPLPPLSESGIRIGASIHRKQDGTRTILLGGVFQCTEAEVEATEGYRSFFRVVALLLMHRESRTPLTFPLVGDALVFEDDVQRLGSYMQSGFEIDVRSRIGTALEAGTYDISAVFGTHLSNVVTLKYP